MKMYYANILGDWVDITECVIDNNSRAKDYFEECPLTFEQKYDYFDIDYDDIRYRIHASCIQMVRKNNL